MNLNLAELAKEHPGLIVQARLGDLAEFAEDLLSKFAVEHERVVLERNTERHLSREETATMLGVDKSTLTRWKKAGYLVPVLLGGKDKYRMSDIDKLLQKTPPKSQTPFPCGTSPTKGKIGGL